MIAATIARNLLPLLAFMLTATFAIDSARAQTTEELRWKCLEAWQRRQNAVKSATFRIRSTLKLTESEQRGARQRLRTLHGNLPDAGEIPQRDMTLTELYEIAFDGDKLRYFMTFDESTHEIAKSVNRNMALLYVTNGTEYRGLESFPDDGQSSGIVLNADKFMPYRIAHVDPILQAFRPFSRHHQLISDLEVVDGDHEIDGKPVLVMHQRYDGTSFGKQYWTDPSREYVVLRILWMAGDSEARWQTDIEHEQDDLAAWVPVKWVSAEIDSAGRILRSQEFQVVEREINPPLPKSLFELEFDAGVSVSDMSGR